MKTAFWVVVVVLALNLSAHGQGFDLQLTLDRLHRDVEAIKSALKLDTYNGRGSDRLGSLEDRIRVLENAKPPSSRSMDDLRNSQVNLRIVTLEGRNDDLLDRIKTLEESDSLLRDRIKALETGRKRQ